MPKKKPTLWDVQVRAQPADKETEHAYIDVRPHFDADLRGHTYAEVLSAHRWIAGILGRLAALLADDVASSRREHGCQSWDIPGLGPDDCDVDTGGLVGSHLADLFEPLDVWMQLSVPKGERREWKVRVEKLLAEILEGEAYQPTIADERRWRAGFEAPPPDVNNAQEATS